MKYKIEIETGRMKQDRDRTYIFSTDHEIPVKYFTERKTLSAWSFPRYVEGTVEDYYENGGGMCEWKDFDNFGQLYIQNIYSIKVNGADINDPIIEEAFSKGAEARFPLMYHAQFIFKQNPEWIFNWYITTGTLSKQKTTDKYFRMKVLDKSMNVKEALDTCLKELQ